MCKRTCSCGDLPDIVGITGLVYKMRKTTERVVLQRNQWYNYSKRLERIIEKRIKYLESIGPDGDLEAYLLRLDLNMASRPEEWWKE